MAVVGYCAKVGGRNDGCPCDDQHRLECGVYLPGEAPRRKPAKKTPEELAAIRAKAWATRRARKGDPDA